MGALVGISLWVALATVVPGLVTIAVFYLIFATAGFEIRVPSSEWVIAGFAVTAMVLTQAVGILVEDVLIRFRWLGPWEQTILVPSDDSSGDLVQTPIEPYTQYSGLYVVLARLTEHEDSQGHLKRCLAQFFLTNNTLVSFGSGVILAFGLALDAQGPTAVRLAACGVGCLLAVGVSYWVATIRFREMAKSLWAIQTNRPTPDARPATG